MKIIIQIIKEFWIPLILAISWVLYNIFWNVNSETWNFQKAVNIFGPTFFLLSWLTCQYFRVKKQTRVEDSFGSMETRLNELLNGLESKTTDMIGHISGGNSFPYFQIGNLDSNTNKGVLMVIPEGEHPQYDVSACIVDLQKFEKVKSSLSFVNMEYSHTNIHIGNLTQTHACMVQEWTVENDIEQSYNIFFTARNGSFTQLMRLKKIDGNWVVATKVKNNEDKILYEQIDYNYPKDDEGNVCWEDVN